MERLNVGVEEVLRTSYSCRLPEQIGEGACGSQHLASAHLAEDLLQSGPGVAGPAVRPENLRGAWETTSWGVFPSEVGSKCVANDVFGGLGMEEFGKRLVD